MSLTTLRFDSEEAYRIARDIHLDILERDGQLPEPRLEILMEEGRAEEVTAELEKRGVSYVAESYA